MNKSRKEELLYKKAKGQFLNISTEEQKELKPYKVDRTDASFATHSNIKEYIVAVDKGCKISFYDWCMNNCKADRRVNGASKEEMISRKRGEVIAAAAFGWLSWGAAVYWMFNGRLSVGACSIVGAIISIILYKRAREWVMFTLFLLPIILAAVFVS